MLQFFRFNWRAAIIEAFAGMLRERLPLGMLIGMPLLQLLLFGFAVNGDPRHLPLGVLCGESGPFSRAVLSAMENTGYFKIAAKLENEEAGQRALSRGELPFVLNIPSDFDRRVLRGENPAILLEADATDPLTVNNALAAAVNLPLFALQREQWPLADAARGAGLGAGVGEPVFSIIIHRLYNPESLTHYNIVPGLLGMVLTLALVMMTALSFMRGNQAVPEERGLEVMAGKILFFTAIGLLQAGVVMLAARFIFHSPFLGNLAPLFVATVIFTLTNVCAGVFIASLAQSQAQALHMSVFYFMPNMMLSGFMFPFLGMPEWARAIGHMLPLTYFSRLAKGILLKGNGIADIWPDFWPLLIFAGLGIIVAALRYTRMAPPSTQPFSS